MKLATEVLQLCEAKVGPKTKKGMPEKGKEWHVKINHNGKEDVWTTENNVEWFIQEVIRDMYPNAEVLERWQEPVKGE